jgi:hypothetical protein
MDEHSNQLVLVEEINNLLEEAPLSAIHLQHNTCAL